MKLHITNYEQTMNYSWELDSGHIFANYVVNTSPICIAIVIGRFPFDKSYIEDMINEVKVDICNS